MTRFSNVLVASLVLLAALAAPRITLAVDHRADQAGPADWDDTATWNTGTVPGASDQVFIGSAAPGVATASVFIDGAGTRNSSNVFLGESGTTPNGTLSMTDGADLVSGASLFMSRASGSTSLFSLTDSTATFNGSTGTNFGNASFFISNQTNSLATISLDNSTLTGANGMAIANDSFNGTRATINLVNGSHLDLTTNHLGIAGHNTPSSRNNRATFNVDETSRMSIRAGGIFIHGGETGQPSDIAVYNIPLASVLGELGKIYARDGINQIALKGSGGTSSRVEVNVDSTLADIGGFEQAASTGPISWNSSSISIASPDQSIGRLNFRSVTITNFGAAGDDSNHLARTGGDATLTLDDTTLTSSPSSGTFNMVRFAGNGARATLNVINGSHLDWQNGGLHVAAHNTPFSSNARASINIDEDSLISVRNGSLEFHGAENSGTAVYNIPLASAQGELGKIFASNGITGIATRANGGIVSKVTVNVDSTLADNGSFKQAASSNPISWNSFGIQIGSGTGSEGRLNLKQVTLTNFGYNFDDGNHIGRFGGKGTLTLDGATLTSRSGSGALELARGGHTGSRATLTLTNGSHLDWVNGNFVVQGSNTPGGSDARATFNIDASSRITVRNGSLRFGGAELAGPDGFAVYDIPLTTTLNTLGKIFALNGIAAIAVNDVGGGVHRDKVIVNLDSTLAPSGGFERAASSSLNANNSSLSIGSRGWGELNLTSVTYDNVNSAIIGSGGGRGTLRLTDATFGKNSSNDLVVGNDTNTNTRGQILMDEGQITIAGGRSLINRNANTTSSTMGSQIVGNGSIDFLAGGNFRNNGVVKASGGALAITGTATVDTQLTTLAQVSTGFYGQNGWYAEEGTGDAMLSLPTLTSVGTNRTWGGTATSTTPVLVNSVRFFNVSGLTSNTIDGSLLAVDHSSIPAGLVNPIGVWDFGTSGDLTSAQMTIRFDDLHANLANIVGGESALKLFHYDGAIWVDITDYGLNSGSFVNGIDTTNNWIQSIAFDSFSPFAIAEDALNPSGVPEPSTYALALLGLVGLGLVARHKRKRRA